jgi:hypothetical protein
MHLGLMAAAVAGMGLGMRSATGAWLVLVALTGIIGASSIRATRMVSRRQSVSVLGYGQALTVATVYDLARALALVRRVGHDTRRKAGR